MTVVRLSCRNGPPQDVEPLELMLIMIVLRGVLCAAVCRATSVYESHRSIESRQRYSHTMADTTVRESRASFSPEA